MNIEKMKLSELRPAEYNPRVEWINVNKVDTKRADT